MPAALYDAVGVHVAFTVFVTVGDVVASLAVVPFDDAVIAPVDVLSAVNNPDAPGQLYDVVVDNEPYVDAGAVVEVLPLLKWYVTVFAPFDGVDVPPPAAIAGYDIEPTAILSAVT